ncbi:MAG TPA: NUDIX hydrolase [Acidobacteriaceae bacterium]|jgi:ADP-ribose pyrophosphatase|nr:NUDIX hydrolase [Acidobacteriaceae bacterium]
MPSKKIAAPKSSTRAASARAKNIAAARKPRTATAPKQLTGRARILSSKTVYKGNVFWVTSDEVLEPGGVRARRDVVRHNGSVVILAVDASTTPDDPQILLIRQYRHPAGQFLLELPAGRIDPGEKMLPAAKRELLEETGFRAKRWSHHVRYFASPGFVSEAMNIFLAEDLLAGEATPEEDERIELHFTPLSECVRLALEGKLHDGKLLIGVLFYYALRSASTK